MSDFKFVCPGCGKPVEGESSLSGADVVCPLCGRQFKAPVLLKPAAAGAGEAVPAAHPSAADTVKNFSRKFVGRVTELAGEEKIEGFSLKALLSQVFSRHSEGEIEEYFTVGTLKTTPPLAEVDTSWPKPWLFFRLFAGALIVYLALLMAYNQYDNLNLVPGLIFVGSFGVPSALIVFFLEMNVRRNVSLYQVMKLVFAGGVLGLVSALLLYQISGGLKLTWLGGALAGPVEESAKLVAVLLILHSMRHRYVLNGLVFGAAIGAGFAAFESMGYALRAGLDDTEAMKSVIILRGLLTPFGHIVWTGMSVAALWKVMGSAKFEWAMLKDMRFLRVFLIAVGCHAVWDLPIDLPFYAKYAVLGIVAWIVILALIQNGLKQVRAEKEKEVIPAQVEPAAGSPDGAGKTS